MLLVFLMLISLWLTSKEYWPESIKRSFFGHYLTVATDGALLFSLETLGYIQSDRYTKNIIHTNPKNVSGLIINALNAKNLVLLYVFSDECFTCYSDFFAVNNIARDYKKKPVVVLPVAIHESKIGLAQFLHHKVFKLHSNIIMVSNKHEPYLRLTLEKSGLIDPRFSYRQVPYLMLIESNKTSHRFRFGSDGEIEVRKLIDASLEQRQAKALEDAFEKSNP